jgi:hypothetical protein
MTAFANIFLLFSAVFERPVLIASNLETGILVANFVHCDGEMMSLRNRWLKKRIFTRLTNLTHHLFSVGSMRREMFVMSVPYIVTL